MTTLFILCTACGKISRVTTGDFLSRSGITRQTFLHSTHQPFCCGRCTQWRFPPGAVLLRYRPFDMFIQHGVFARATVQHGDILLIPGALPSATATLRSQRKWPMRRMAEPSVIRKNFASSHIKSSVSGGACSARAAKSHPRRSAGRSGSEDRSADSRRSRRFGCRLAVETLLVSRLRARWSGRRCSGAHLPRKAQRWRRSGRWSGRRRSARTVLPAADRPATAN